MESSNRSSFESNEGDETAKTKSDKNSSLEKDATSFLKFSEKKRGRRKKEEKNYDEVTSIDNQSKYFVDLSKDSENLEMIRKILKDANNKSYGREIILKDLVLAFVSKINQKDIERIQEQSLTEMERVQRHLDDFNLKNNSSLSLGEFLVKKFNL